MYYLSEKKASFHAYLFSRFGSLTETVTWIPVLIVYRFKQCKISYFLIATLNPDR
jgi:hypothetical protein